MHGKNRALVFRVGQSILVALSLCSVSFTLLAHTLVLAGPPAPVSYPLVHMAHHNDLSDVFTEIRFQLWRTPDQLRVLSMHQQAQVLAMPTNVAANLYQRGISLRLLNVSNWGLLYIVSRSADLTELADLAGQEIVVPFRGDMPDLVVKQLLAALGIQVRWRYVATPQEAASLLLSRRAQHVVLTEPLVSMVLQKANHGLSGILAPTVYRSISLQHSWAEQFGGQPRIPQAGIAVQGDLLNNPVLRDRIEQAYQHSLQWCLKNQDECASLVVDAFGMLTPEAVAASLDFSGLAAVPLSDARSELEHFYHLLHQSNPEVIGGSLPDDAFYQLPEMP